MQLNTIEWNSLGKTEVDFDILNQQQIQVEKKATQKEKRGDEWKNHTVVHSAPICGFDYSYAE